MPETQDETITALRDENARLRAQLGTPTAPLWPLWLRRVGAIVRLAVWIIAALAFGLLVFILGPSIIQAISAALSR